MDLKRIADQAKGLVDKRGGTGNLKEDAAELRDIASGEGSLKDKAKAAVEAVKDPGADEAASPETSATGGEPAAVPDPVPDQPGAVEEPADSRGRQRQGPRGGAGRGGGGRQGGSRRRPQRGGRGAGGAA